MRTLKRALAAVAALGAAAIYTWIAAVRAAPGVKQRKAESRSRRAASPPDTR